MKTRESAPKGASQISAPQRDRDQSTVVIEVIPRIRFAESLALRSALGPVLRRAMGRGVMNVTPDEIEAIASRLDADQLAHVGAALTARASDRRAENFVAIVPQDSDPDSDAAFAKLEPLADRLLHHAERSRSIGIDDDIIGCSIAVELLGLGYSEEETAKLIAEVGIDWHPRTADERLVAAIAELLSLGMDPETVRAAFASLEVE
jgi:hypothetical protein